MLELFMVGVGMTGLQVSLKLKLELMYQADFGEHVLSFFTSNLMEVDLEKSNVYTGY